MNRPCRARSRRNRFERCLLRTCRGQDTQYNLFMWIAYEFSSLPAESNVHRLPGSGGRGILAARRHPNLPVRSEPPPVRPGSDGSLYRYSLGRSGFRGPLRIRQVFEGSGEGKLPPAGVLLLEVPTMVTGQEATAARCNRHWPHASSFVLFGRLKSKSFRQKAESHRGECRRPQVLDVTVRGQSSATTSMR